MIRNTPQPLDPGVLILRIRLIPPQSHLSRLLHYLAHPAAPHGPPGRQADAAARVSASALQTGPRIP